MPTILLDTPEVPGAAEAAWTIERTFDAYHSAFKEITRRAHRRFDARDWHGAQSDSLERLELYTLYIEKTLHSLKAGLPDVSKPGSLWNSVKAAYSDLISAREDLELAETFFNSVSLRLFGMVGVDPDLVYVSPEFEVVPERPGRSMITTYRPRSTLEALFAELLQSYRFRTSFVDIDRDARMVARSIDTHLRAHYGTSGIETVEIVDPLFFRIKGAFIVGRIRCAGRTLPLVLPLLNTNQGLVVDAVLLSEDDVSILFSFTRSYFLVELEAPHQLILFLKSIMPLKRLAELYISVGHNKHGKTELYRDLIQHLRTSDDKFEIARGERGMVMVVFTLPSYDIVFKVIRDTFAYPKSIARQQVMEKYNLVFKHDRAGRLVDAQEFENWRFDKDRFTDAVLRDLTTHAAGSVRIEGGTVVISHMYTERRLTPLNLYVREAAGRAAREAVIDYGQTVKDLAATNIFPGDLLLKNFGVTRHGRIVFYDYDELCLLTDCNFRTIPEAPGPGEEFQAEPWFFVAENDVFPEEFISFLGLSGELRDVFMDAHEDLLGLPFWTNMQTRHRSGEIIDIFAYKQNRRFLLPPE